MYDYFKENLSKIVICFEGSEMVYVGVGEHWKGFIYQEWNLGLLELRNAILILFPSQNSRLPFTETYLLFGVWIQKYF